MEHDPWPEIEAEFSGSRPWWKSQALWVSLGLLLIFLILLIPLSVGMRQDTDSLPSMSPVVAAAVGVAL
ncbi:MAG TPA: hypothetical protein ENI86_11010 [Acidimicrobiales bacterium]|nr:hypothetical protein [Acidimicrobiales bacterium]